MSMTEINFNFNSTSGTMEDYQTLCFVFYILNGITGLILNISFLIVNYRQRLLFPKMYVYFLSCLCFNNTVHLLNGLVLQPIALYININPKSAHCATIAIISVATAYNGICLEAVVALHRYIALYYPEKQSKFFSHINKGIITVVVAMYTLATAVGMLLLDDLARVGNTVCGPELDTMGIGHLLYMVGPVTCVKTVCAFCIYKIWRLIKNHQQNAQRLGSGLQDAEDIVRLIAIELLVPICLEYPALVVCILNKHVYIPKMIISACCCLFIMSPVFDPIIIVIVMKPYRKVFLKMWRSFHEQIVVEEETV